MAAEYFREDPDSRRPIQFAKGGKDWAVSLIPIGDSRVFEMWRHDPNVPLLRKDGTPVSPDSVKRHPKDYFEEYVVVSIPKVSKRGKQPSELRYWNKHTNIQGEDNALALGQIDGILEDLMASEENKVHESGTTITALPEPREQ